MNEVVQLLVIGISQGLCLMELSYLCQKNKPYLVLVLVVIMTTFLLIGAFWLSLSFLILLISYLAWQKHLGKAFLLPICLVMVALFSSLTNLHSGLFFLLLAVISLDLMRVFKQANLLTSSLSLLFEGSLVLLIFLTRNSLYQLILLMLLSTYMLVVASLLAYLFNETEMLYARSLDQIMANYITEIDVLYQNIRGWRHDYHNHLQAIKAYLKNGQVIEVTSYLDQLEEKLKEVEQLVKSGNTMLDAIVNSKLSIANEKGIATNVKVFVGKQPLINDVDLCVILGNVLDNAIEANEEILEVNQRMMRVYISILKQQLYITVTNSRPDNQEIASDYSSTKNDKRGLGIRRINQLVEKYDGVINRQFEKQVFVTEILLPLITISDQ